MLRSRLALSFLAILPGTDLAFAEAAARAPLPCVSEIQYSPGTGDARGAWLELHHPGAERLSLSGWKLRGAAQFEFLPGTTINPGDFLVLAETALDFGGGSEILGGLHFGKPLPPSDATPEAKPAQSADPLSLLPKGAKIIELVNAAGQLVDRVAYSKRSPWSPLANGLGHSLERRDPLADGLDPANWAAANSAGWQEFKIRGTATSGRLYLYLEGTGELAIDDLSLAKIVPGGRPSAVLGPFDFSKPTPGFAANGSHRASRVDDGVLRIAATAPGASRSNSITFDGLPLSIGDQVELRLRVRFGGSTPALVARLSQSREGSGLYQRFTSSNSSPGRRNAAQGQALPPSVLAYARHPAQPAPGEAAELRIRLSPRFSQAEGRRLATGNIVAIVGGQGASFPLEALPSSEAPKDSASGQIESGWYRATVPGQKKGSLVVYRYELTGQNGAKLLLPEAEAPTPVFGYRVEDPRSPEAMPRFELRMDAAALQALQRSRYSDAYHPAWLIAGGEVYPGVQVRYRGHTSRGLPKPHWKIKFPPDQLFRRTPGHRAVKTLNLNSSFRDPSYLREQLGFELWRDMGRASCEVWHAELEVNGEYQGLHVSVENPGSRYLARNGLRKGWLWKGYSGARSFPPRGFELEAGDPRSAQDALAKVFEGLLQKRGDALADFIEASVDVDGFVDYLVGCQLIHSADHVMKNYLVYLSPEGQLNYLPWDFDLTHGRNFECRRGFFDSPYLRYDLWDREYRDEKLLFGTRLHPKCDGRSQYNGVIDAFLVGTERFRPQYYARLAECLAAHTHPDLFGPRLARHRARIETAALRDEKRWQRYHGKPGFLQACSELEDWNQKRYLHLAGKLRGLGHPPPLALGADFTSDRRFGPAPLTVSFRSTSIGADSVEWDFGDGTTSRETNPKHVYAEGGRYEVRLVSKKDDRTSAVVRREWIVSW